MPRTGDMAAGCRSRRACLPNVWPLDVWALTPRWRRCSLGPAGSCHGRLQVFRAWVIWGGAEKRKDRPGATAAWLAGPWRPAAGLAVGGSRTQANSMAMLGDGARIRLWVLSREDCTVSAGAMRNQHQSLLGKTIRTMSRCSASLFTRASSSRDLSRFLSLILYTPPGFGPSTIVASKSARKRAISE